MAVLGSRPMKYMRTASRYLPPLVRALALALAVGACAPAVRHREAAGERTSPRAPVAIGPDAEATDVSSIVGKAAPEWDVSTWLGSPPIRVTDLAGRVVLVRWFMASECPYCSATAPTLVDLHRTYEARGLSVVGFYHHKSEGPMDVEKVRSLVVDTYGFRFPVAVDDQWRTLKRWWLDAHPDSWTSVSFLLDRRGIVRFAHLGGAYAPGSADEKQMRAWIETLLAEPGG